MGVSLHYRSYAKINLGLEILGRLRDGYHEILTIFQTIKLHDDITIEPADDLEVYCSDKSIPQGQGNIAFKAAAVLKAKTGFSGGGKILIEKRIQPQAGMGGGSSNAAVTLIGLNELWKTGLSKQDLMESGASVGADVPFFFTGGTALGSHRGDKITPLDDIGELKVLLAIPEIRISTSEAYKQAGKLLTTSDRANNIHSFLRREKGFSSLTNDFELFLFPKYPVLKDIAKSITGLGSLKAGVTGSGSAIFGLFPAGVDLGAVQSRLVAKFPTVGFHTTVSLGRVEFQQTLKQNQNIL